MRARDYLAEIRTEYTNLRELREKLRVPEGEDKQKELREFLKSAAVVYSGILNDVWDTVDQVEPLMCREILFRRYIFLEPWEQIAGELECSISTVYKHHARAVAIVQRFLDARKGR